jgi:YegS/Rv2252/BmrU family lipid kinase
MSEQALKFIFIINPSSGNQKLRNWEGLIEANLDTNNYEILYTRYAGHSSSILSNYNQEENLCIVAVGGDGTVSELVPTILKSKAFLGIIPTGSGNGLARHLRIPLNTAQAIRNLNTGKPRAVDLIKMNDHFCSNTCGIGFGALVTKHFGAKGQRGFRTYFKLALALYKTSQCFDIKLNNTVYKNVWLIEFANSSQLGNDAIVSPFASVTDGIADILIMNRPKPWQVPAFIVMVLSGTILKSGLSKLIKATELKITLNDEQHYHIDGEYMGLIKEAELKMIPSSLPILLPVQSNAITKKI